VVELEERDIGVSNSRISKNFLSILVFPMRLRDLEYLEIYVHYFPGSCAYRE